ncbi:hypothetical protein KBK19_18960 [Microvirga sp. STR05]|uniref:Peptidase M56 domain-containing protein n=1 Tax=Hymenobacter duratus TaxID=2771356 RepID=A0ABR8JN27_9BACT|nr:M56 family metallopeptidase [Hymenobacter duratus]MBD2717131.1 hypothetical protein [Hymenobacter duratus]MBR7952047.1 hypothetical protein [Microvirga sp. STR05]
MTPLLLYMLKANLALLVLLGLYYGLLRSLTFHFLNRLYLLCAMIFAAMCPLLKLSYWNATALAQPWAVVVYEGAATPVATVAAASPEWLLQAVPVLYSLGVAVLAGQLLLRLAALLRLRNTSIPGSAHGIAYRQLAVVASPFTFGPDIYIGAGAHTAADLHAVLLHEQVHARQVHTLDVLLAHLLRVLCWFNPAALRLPELVQRNLEFLTDAVVLESDQLPRKAYQYSLLRVSSLLPGPPLASSFSFLPLKHRIAMMNQPKSKRLQALRYFLALPVAFALLLALPSAVPVSTSAAKVAPAAPLGLPTNAVFYLDGKQVPLADIQRLDTKTIAGVAVLKGADAARAFAGTTQPVVVVTTLAGASSPEAEALAARLPHEQPVDMSYLSAEALAYIVKTYPGHRLTGVWKVTTQGQPVRYRAEIAKGRRPLSMLFDEQGHALTQ